MSAVHNDLHSWAGKARAHGNDTIVITVDLADKAADEIVAKAGEIAELKCELMAERNRHAWQPINTAPNDEMFIWAKPKRDGKWSLGLAYRNVSGNWSDAYGSDTRGATHWARLPTAPEVLA